MPTVLVAAEDVQIFGHDGNALSREATDDLITFYDTHGVHLDTLKTLATQDTIAPVSMMQQALAQSFTPLQVQQMVAGNIASTAMGVTGNTDVNLVVNGKSVYSDPTLGMSYITDAGRTMVPLRVIHESVAMSVVYKSGEIFIDNARVPYHAKFITGENHFTLNGTTIEMDTPTVVSQLDHAYVPLRALAETLGEVSSDEATRTVTVTIKVDTEYPGRENGSSFFPVPDTTKAYQLNQKEDGTTVLQRLDKNTTGITEILFPQDYADIYTPETYDRLSISQVKVINGDHYIGVSHHVSNFSYSIESMQVSGHGCVRGER